MRSMFGWREVHAAMAVPGVAVFRRGLTKRLLIVCLGLAAAAGSGAAPPLLTPAELDAQLGRPGLRVIDVRSPEEFADKHIPGALSAPYGRWRGPASNPGELPPLATLAALLRQVGLTPDTHAVLVSGGEDATDFGAAARVYWTLKVLGLKELSLLNGGMGAWAQAGLRQDTVAGAVTPSAYLPTLDTTLIATREDLRARQGTAALRLLDARLSPFFMGQTRHPAALVPGTVKGALNLEYTRWFAPDAATMLPAEEVRKLAATTPAAGPAGAVSFCNTGHWAAINWFALSEVAGLQGVKMYPGSMVDWSQGPGAAAMDHVPGRAGQLLIDFMLWRDRTFP